MRMVKTVKVVLVINAATLAINGIIVWLTIIRNFPPILGIMLFVGCLSGAVWLSCWLNGKLPKKRTRAFYAAETERMRRFI